jgi:hypothetical protein
MDFRESPETYHRDDRDEVVITPWFERARPEVREHFFARTHVLKGFRVKNIDTDLAKVTGQKEKHNYPERALWEAVECMMLDEALRDRLLKKQQRGLECDPADKQEYQRIIARYRVLIELVDKAYHPVYAEQEVIPHLHLTDLRVRLADLLANQAYYFPKDPLPVEDRVEAFKRLSQQYTSEDQAGKKAEIAVIGLLRYGPQWVWGGVKNDAQFLHPATHVEQVMPREDILRQKATGARGRFEERDIIFFLEKSHKPRPVQIKTGVFIDRPEYANLAAPPLLQAFENLVRSAWMYDKTLRDQSVTEQQKVYATAVGEILSNLGLTEEQQDEMRRAMLPGKRALAKVVEGKKEPTMPQAVTYKDVVFMLKENPAFRRLMTLNGAPASPQPSDFGFVSDLVRRLRQEHPHEPCWQEWPAPPKAAKPTVRSEYVPRYARI